VPFAAALSEHPVTVEATAEVVGDVLDRVGDRPDIVAVFVTAAHVPHLADIIGTVQAALDPGVVVGTTASSVLGRDREVEDEPGIALWAGTPGPVEAVRIEALRTPEGTLLQGLDEEAVARAGTLILLADPLSFPVDDVVEMLAEEAPLLQVVGGMASAGLAPGANRFVIGRRGDGATVHTDGAVGVLLGPDQAVTAVVSQGCRPIGDPFVVTRAERNIIEEIGGSPALVRLDDLFGRLGDADRELVQQGLHIGRVIDEHKPDFGRGDFLVRNVIGADRSTGAIAIGDVVPVGATVQFHVRDAVSADEDLHSLLAGVRGDGALVFTCNGRGTRLFGRPDHDAEAVAGVVRGAAAGMFCAGEIGPVGQRSFVHGFTASLAIFRDTSPG
jgi:small ligand-binding sensory domain FIST